MPFLRLSKMWKSQGVISRWYAICWSVSQPNIWTLSLTRLAVWRRALSCKRKIPSDSIPGRFDFMARHNTLSHQETNHTSLFFFACLHFQCWTDTLYTTLTSRKNKETTVLTCAISLCVSPILQMAVSIHNSVASFCEECVLWRVFGFHLTVPYMLPLDPEISYN